MKDEGNLQIHGKEVLAFTKLSATADRWGKYSGDANKVIYMHKVNELMIRIIKLPGGFKGRQLL